MDAIRSICLPLLFWLALGPAPTRAETITYPVSCSGVQIGTVTMNSGFGITGNFTVAAPFGTLAAAAAFCGEHHFNWYQAVVGDTAAPVAAGGNTLTAPYVDPPPGGYLDSNPSAPGNESLWADNLPWYYNEGADPPAGTAGFDPNFHISKNTTATTLNFQDQPGGLSTNILFKTWLVSLNADGSLHSFHPGFTWNWIHNPTDGIRIIEFHPINPSPNQPPGGPGFVVPFDSEYKDIIGGFATRLEPVPEPRIWTLVALSLAGLTVVRWRRNRRVGQRAAGGQPDVAGDRAGVESRVQPAGDIYPQGAIIRFTL